MDLTKDAIDTFKRQIEENVAMALHTFHMATGTFPSEIRIRLGPLINVFGIERPKIDVEIDVADA